MPTIFKRENLTGSHLPLDVYSPSFDGTKGSRYGMLARIILEAQAYIEEYAIYK